VPVGTRGRRVRQLRWCLAAWLAVLLAIAPFARPLVPVDLPVMPAASAESVVADENGSQSEQPAARLRPAQPSTPGILSRQSLLETALGLAPVKSSLLRPSATEPSPPPQLTLRFAGDVTDVFNRSSVGTARTPTGPPS
jgi:hypothetical protein